ncbi:MAG: 4Fe-4S binding protein [Lentisphaerae bacterium]|nr:4Fe-4S binding protein [Lentisphaerota bacterium]
MTRILITPWRRLVQVAGLLIAGPWLAVGLLQCPYRVPFVSCLSCPTTICPGRWLFLPALLAIVVSQVVQSRLFCGWFCPLGFIQDALAALCRRGRPPTPGPALDRAARWIKVAILAAIAVILIRAPDERAYDYVVRAPHWLDLEAPRVAAALGLARYPARWAMVGIGLVGSLAVARFWCRYLCPLGAALALTRPLARRTLHRDDSHCRECTACSRACTMHTAPGSTECIACGECADACPSGALSSRRTPATEPDASPTASPAGDAATPIEAES